LAKVDRESSTVTWIWLWDALALLMQFYPRVSAEQKLVRAIALRAVGHKRLALTDETVVTVSTQGVASVIPRATASDLPIWRKLAGERDEPPRVLFAAISWEESTIEAYWRGRHRIYRIKVVRDNVLRLLPEDALATPPEEQPETPKVVRRVTAKEWITAEAKRLKRTDAIPADISKTAFAKLLADNMDRAATYDHSISIRPVRWRYIRNYLSKWGLSDIE